MQLFGLDPGQIWLRRAGKHWWNIFWPYIGHLWLKNERSFWKFWAKFGCFLTFCPLKLMGHKKAAIAEIHLALEMNPQAFIGLKMCVFGRSGGTPSCPPEITHYVLKIINIMKWKWLLMKINPMYSDLFYLSQNF